MKGKPNGEIKIETGVPMPTKGRGAPRKYPWYEMNVGDSFLVPGKTHKRWHATAKAERLTGFKFSVRTVEGGVRVWRIA